MTGTSTTKSNRHHAVAVFAKPPKAGLVKTRLARSTGEEFATDFYKLCIEQIKNTFLNFNNDDLDIYWALPDYAPKDHFPVFQTVNQGPGQLGDKLAYVQKNLFSSGYKRVTLIGSDSPQIHYNTYENFHKNSLTNSSCYIGPTDDGGFYLFSASQPTIKELLSTKYSQNTTCSELLENLKASQRDIIKLKKEFDIDFIGDIKKLKDRLESEACLTDTQKRMLEQINTLK